MLTFQLLGPLKVAVDDRPVQINAKKPRILLAALLLGGNRGVSNDRLVSLLWDGEEPPKNSRGALHIHINRLRRTLTDAAGAGGDLIRTTPDGYAIDVGADELDILRFEQLEHEFRRQRGRLGPQAESDLAEAALALWRGPALCDIPSERVRRRIAAQLAERRLALMECRFELKLRTGAQEEAIGGIRSALINYPLHEVLWAQLIRALYETGRKAESLEAYRALSRTLAEEAGIDPGRELQELHRSILDDSYAPPGAYPAVAPPEPEPEHDGAPIAPHSWTELCQLPPVVADFVGREEPLEQVAALLKGNAAGSALPIVVVTGPAGVGKTALAVRAAHQVRSHFLDGQWFVRFDGADRPESPSEVLAELLRRSGVSSAAIPSDVESRAALFRARLADRRVLLLLDDVRDAERIVPLLPGTSSCTVLITSRSNLTELVALHGARLVPLNVLTAGEAESLLGTMLGPGRSAARRELAELAELCAHLPLALRVAAASLLSRPRLPLRTYVEELRHGNRVAKLTVGSNRRAAVQAAFDLSYHAQTPRAQRLFRTLGLVPVRDYTAASAAALLDLSVPDAELLLQDLAFASLLEEHLPGRYRFHELMQIYAAERAREEDTPQARRAAELRLFGWYLHSAASAVVPRYPGMIRLPLAERPAAVHPLSFATDEAALQWLLVERANLITVIACTAAGDSRQAHEIGWLLTDVLRGYFWSGWNGNEWKTAAGWGLASARKAGDPPAQWAMNYSLGLANYRSADYDRSHAHLTEACGLAARHGLRAFAAETSNAMGLLLLAQGRLGEAARALEGGLDLDRELDLPMAEARARRHLGSVEHARGHFDNALAQFARAQEIDREHGVEFTKSENLGRIGLTLCALGRSEEGLRALWLALRTSHDLGGRFDRVAAHARLAVGQLMERQPKIATEHARAAEMLAKDLGDQIVSADAYNILASCSRMSGRLDLAEQEHERAAELAALAGHAQSAVEALFGLALIRMERRLPEEALDCLARAMGAARGDRLVLCEAQSLLLRSMAFCAMGAWPDAVRSATEAVRAYHALGGTCGEERSRELVRQAELRMFDLTQFLRSAPRFVPLATTVLAQSACGFDS
ncbi:BTAD domain-containing putative transcriptional regulator [Kitasatospora sp. NPDC004723]|uniref:AfsR/SARP family transcriptional regulator n=1 Tax=Kitasatospora sp. NPDC004723 TaxID=3154288 RepID=UPI0033BE83B2